MSASTPNSKLATRLLWATALAWCVGISSYVLIHGSYVGLCASALSIVLVWPWLLLTARRFALQPAETRGRAFLMLCLLMLPLTGYAATQLTGLERNHAWWWVILALSFHSLTLHAVAPDWRRFWRVVTACVALSILTMQLHRWFIVLPGTDDDTRPVFLRSDIVLWSQLSTRFEDSGYASAKQRLQTTTARDVYIAALRDCVQGARSEGSHCSGILQLSTLVHRRGDAIKHSAV